MSADSPTVVCDCRNNLGESVVWDEKTARLWWANIHEREIWSWSPTDGRAPVGTKLDERVGAIGLRQSAGLIVALESGFSFHDPETGTTQRIADVERELPTTRLNDGRIDPAGRFVCGGMDESSPQKGISAVYVLDAGGKPKTLINGIHCANSICWSPDGAVFYFTDMPSRRIDAYDYDVSTGEVSNRRTFVDLRDEVGLADGSTVDADGYLWNAQWGGGKVVRYAPDGSVDREVGLPVSNPTCLCFGGEDLSTLYITSAWFGLDVSARAREPHAGSILALRPGVRGVPEHRFAV